MSYVNIDLETLGERLTKVRKSYGESIDLPNLGQEAFAALLGIPVTLYASCERGEQEPTVEFLIALRHRTKISLDWLLDADPAEATRPRE